MKEISTTISCHKDKQKNLLQVVVGIIVHNPKSPSSLKQWFQGISWYSRKEGADKLNVDNTLFCEF